MGSTYLFVGNRFNVLRAMIEMGLNIRKILAFSGSILERELVDRQIGFEGFSEKDHLIESISTETFEILVSNGCPYILPVSRIKRDGQLFVNIHPSLLPDLRGMHPINGAILFNRHAGVSCHHMDDGVDTGPVISQINLGTWDDLGLLYQTSFLAEGDVFVKAYERRFVKDGVNTSTKGTVYYSRKDEDRRIDFTEDSEMIVRRVRAFGIPTQGAYMLYMGQKITVLCAEVVNDSYLRSRFELLSTGEVALKYDGALLVKSRDGLVLFKGIGGGLESVSAGTNLFQSESA